MKAFKYFEKIIRSFEKAIRNFDIAVPTQMRYNIISQGVGALPRSQSLTGNAILKAPPPFLAAAAQLKCISRLWLETRFERHLSLS
ncbi:hypothetical protein LC613_11835 [Nostoc sphaeroides CHAB 2801]|uniref:hypothetical protein n=1 Tax=Nostoc sphaeroides TaxID=446679 RepID=UPI000E4F35AF|nr:hypothetical protein [Nostoc sphaeroides]MCC5628747.1 hypothetical protein [Nostoc sphaeroides CHAB 2801]